jgi:hypothetical protein
MISLRNTLEASKDMDRYLFPSAGRWTVYTTVDEIRPLHVPTFSLGSIAMPVLPFDRFAISHSGLNKANTMTVRPRTIARGAKTSSPNQFVEKMVALKRSRSKTDNRKSSNDCDSSIQKSVRISV